MTIHLGLRMHRDLEREAQHRGWSLENVIHKSLAAGLEQLWWEDFADDLIQAKNEGKLNFEPRKQS